MTSLSEEDSEDSRFLSSWTEMASDPNRKRKDDGKRSVTTTAVFTTVAFLGLAVSIVIVWFVINRSNNGTLSDLVEQMGKLRDVVERNSQSASARIEMIDSKLEVLEAALGKKVDTSIGQVCGPFKMRDILQIVPPFPTRPIPNGQISKTKCW